MKKLKQAGMSLLETAVILPTILLFTVGSIDVANYFRSYTAVKEGVDVGLRCLYPTDAACLAVAAPKTIPQYNAYIPPLFSPYFDYDGIEKKLLLPNYTYGPLQAQTLATVSYQTLSTTKNRYQAMQREYPVTSVGKVIAVEYPSLGTGQIVNGRDAVIGGQGQKLEFTREAKRSEPRAISCKTLKDNIDKEPQVYDKFIVNIPESPFAAVTETNELQDLNAIDDCIAYRNNKQYVREEARSICRASDMRKFARLFFKLNGQALGSSKAHGHLDLFLEYKDSSGEWVGGARNSLGSMTNHASLGGQDFSDNFDDFYPRGFTRREAIVRPGKDKLYANDGEGVETGYDENGASVSNYESHGYIYVPWGSEVRITLKLRYPEDETCSDAQSIGWKVDFAGSIVRIGYPQLIQERIACSERLTRMTCEENNPSCTINPTNFSNQLLQETTSKKAFGISCDLGRPVQLSKGQLSGCQTSASALGADQDPEKGWEMIMLPNTDCFDQKTATCPKNIGVTDVATKNSTGRFTIRNSVAAQAACPADKPIAGTQEWTEKIETVYSQPIALNAQDCTFDSEAPMPRSLVPTAVTQYKKLILPKAAKSSVTQLDTSGRDPAELKRDPRYACNAVTTEQRYFREDAKDSFSSEEWQRLVASTFAGVHEQLGCNATNVLRQQAQTIGLDPKSFFAVTKAQPTGTAEYQVGSIDSCMLVRPDKSLATSNLRSMVPGGPFDQHEIPFSCFIPDGKGGVINSCIFIPAGVRKIEDTGSYKLDPSMAKAVAADTIQTFLPSSNYDPSCATNPKPDCIAISVEPGNELNEQQLLTQPLRVKASVQQPLLVLGNKPIEVSYEATRPWEGQ